MYTSSFSRIRLLDCTLRDGGHVNDFDFGAAAIGGTVGRLCEAGADIVELGFLKNGGHGGGSTLFSHVDEAQACLPPTPTGTAFSLMIRPDWYDIAQLAPCDGTVAHIRFAFHERDLALTLRQAERARVLGYRVFFNPVNVTGYAPRELEQLLSTLNDFKPDTVSIVDTFGALLPADLDRIAALFFATLAEDIGIGLHLHENLSLSMGLAHQFIERSEPGRRLTLDSSLLGMGREPGNLCTELLMAFLNRCHGRNFALAPIYHALADFIEPIKRRLPWGYMPAYAMTAFDRMHRSYAEYLLGKADLSLVDIHHILSRVTGDDVRAHFDEAVIESLYLDFVSGR